VTQGEGKKGREEKRMTGHESHAMGGTKKKGHRGLGEKKKKNIQKPIKI